MRSNFEDYDFFIVYPDIYVKEREFDDSVDEVVAEDIFIQKVEARDLV